MLAGLPLGYGSAFPVARPVRLAHICGHRGGHAGASNAASSLIPKWKMQLACAGVWWAASIAACFGSDAQVMGVFLVAIFFCQIVFGIYGIIAGSRKVGNGTAHA